MFLFVERSRVVVMKMLWLPEIWVTGTCMEALPRSSLAGLLTQPATRNASAIRLYFTKVTLQKVSGGTGASHTPRRPLHKGENMATAGEMGQRRETAMALLRESQKGGRKAGMLEKGITSGFRRIPSTSFMKARRFSMRAQASG